jgi:cytochrome b561
MKKSDLGVIMIHWMLAVTLMSTAASGLCLWATWLQPPLAFLFEPGKVGAIHIGLGVAIMTLALVYLWYQKHKNTLDHLALRRPLTASWRRVGILLYWVLFAIVIVETATGILLTKLIDKDVLVKVFGVERVPLATLHLFLVAPVLLFPVAHVTIHWLDGRGGRVLSIFRPHVYPRKPSVTVIMVKLREENARLRKEKVNHDSRR